jgi:crotonobetainyl-CoA:carnitine CoA-transferase CaiB-like acyl-CoA transferase
MSPSGIYKARDDAFIAVAIASDEQFAGLCQAMGEPQLAEDLRFAKALDRLQKENASQISRKTAEWVAGQTTDAIMALAEHYRFPASPVCDDLMISEDAWRQERGNVVEYNDTMYGRLKLERGTVRLSETPGRIKWLTRPLGYHNRYIFKTLLGLREDQIKALEAARVVGYWDYRVGQRPPVYYDIDNDPIFNYRDESHG